MGKFVCDVNTLPEDEDEDEILDRAQASAERRALLQSSLLPSLRQWHLQVVHERTTAEPWLKAELKAQRHQYLQAILVSASVQALGS